MAAGALGMEAGALWAFQVVFWVNKGGMSAFRKCRSFLTGDSVKAKYRKPVEVDLAAGLGSAR